MDVKETENKILEWIHTKESKESGFLLLVETYQEQLYWHIRKMVLSHDDAKDILQEVFIRVWQNIGKFKGESKLFTWLYRIATNEISRFLDGKKRMHKNQENLRENLENELENSPWVNGDEIQIKLQKAILQLPNKQRLVFNMRYFDELSYEEMAEILKTSVNSMKVSFFHAKTKIEEILKTEII
jgi:RNA polymerase sigma-70 factor, ECF subfamily